MRGISAKMLQVGSDWDCVGDSLSMFLGGRVWVIV